MRFSRPRRELRLEQRRQEEATSCQAECPQLTPGVARRDLQPSIEPARQVLRVGLEAAIVRADERLLVVQGRVRRPVRKARVVEIGDHADAQCVSHAET